MKMADSRRFAVLSFLFAPFLVKSALTAQEPTAPDDHNLHIPKSPDEDQRLPNGKSQRDEIARQQHADALKDVESLVTAAEELRDELKRAGDYVVPVTSVRKTEEIEKLAKRIRGRLKN